MCSDAALSELLDGAVPTGFGIGGKSALLDVDGTPVFVKHVPLTDLDMEPQHVRSTANLFDLPFSVNTGLARSADQASERGVSLPCTP